MTSPLESISTIVISIMQLYQNLLTDLDKERTSDECNVCFKGQCLAFTLFLNISGGLPYPFFGQTGEVGEITTCFYILVTSALLVSKLGGGSIACAPTRGVPPAA